MKPHWEEVDRRHHQLVDPESGWVLGYVRIHSLGGDSRDPGLPNEWEEFLAQAADHRALGRFQTLEEARSAVEATLDSEISQGEPDSSG
jgi:uncharacterized protein (DUF2267 family)